MDQADTETLTPPCPACGDDRVAAIAVGTLDDTHVQVRLRCVNCGQTSIEIREAPALFRSVPESLFKSPSSLPSIQPIEHQVNDDTSH